MKVAIAWYGAEGQESYKYFSELGHDVTIVTPKVAEQFPIPEGAKSIVGDDAFQYLNGFDLVVRSSGVRPDVLKTDGKIWSATNEFFAQCPAPIIGVTGTKGKGTTSSLIASILKAAGYTVHLVGNIGIPALQVLPTITSKDIVVFEMSSFQLWDIEKSPHIAVVLMIEADHQDVHVSIDEYVAAKSNIRRFQEADDRCFYHPFNIYSRQIAETSKTSQPIRYGVAEDGGCYVKENTFFVQDQQICGVDTLQLVGQHNIENACAAISAAWVYTQDIGAITQGLHMFDGLPHRTKYIRTVNGVTFYDDNYSSSPGATIAAIRSFTEPEIHIMGGYDKQVDFTELATAIAERENVKKVILIGQTRHKIAQALNAAGRPDVCEISDEITLRPIIEQAYRYAEPGDVIVMSPGCASFDMFKNFGDRGDQFVEIVENL